MSQQPSVGRIVHYVSRGSADGAFPSACRAAIVTEVDDSGRVSLCVLHPDGALFARDLLRNESHETPGDPDCPNKATHGNPLRYCACGWIESSYVPGTWHWPERV